MSSIPHPAGSDGDWQAQYNARQARGEFDDGEPQARDNVVDPRDPFAHPPPYVPEALPKTFEDWVTTKLAEWGGDRGVYATAFIAMHCSVLSDTVKMQTNPQAADIWKAPNDFSLILGKTGQNKSGAWKDITQNQRGWQEAMSRSQAKQVRNKRAHVEMSFLQATTIEGMMAQIADNKGGRLVVGSQEMMTFYGSAAAHRKEDAISQMAHTVCAVYDGDSYNKRLVNKTYSIPSALATIIGATTLDSVMQWKGFPTLVSSGFMARHTIGVMGSEPQSKEKKIPGALEKHAEIMIKMRALTNVNLVLSDEAAEKWEAYKVKKEAQIAHMDDMASNDGLLAWDRKYQMRIMSAASIIQLYEFIEGGQKDCEESVLAMTEADLDKMDASETKVLRTIRISEESLRRAVKLVMGYLRRMQEHFYGVATGVTEFTKEMTGFVAKRLTEDDPADPSSRHILRKELAHNGPTRLRWGSVEDRRENANRYIRVLIENGYIEVYEPPNQRKMTKFKQEWEMPHYKMTDAFFQFFEPHRAWFTEHHRARMETMRKNLGTMSMEDL